MAEEKQDKFVMDFDVTERADRPPQEYYDDIKAKFAEERDLRLEYRPPGTENYRDLDGAMVDLARDVIEQIELVVERRLGPAEIGEGDRFEFVPVEETGAAVIGF